MDMVSYIMGKHSESGKVEIDGQIICTDDGDGNITVEVMTDGEQTGENN